MLIEELRVKISAEMGSLENVLNQIKTDMTTLSKRCADAETQVKNMNKSATSGMKGISTNTKAIEANRSSVQQLYKDIDAVIAQYKSFGTLLANQNVKQNGAFIDLDIDKTKSSISQLIDNINKYQEALNNARVAYNEALKNGMDKSNPEAFSKLLVDVNRYEGAIRASNIALDGLKAKLYQVGNVSGVVKTTESLEQLKESAYQLEKELSQAQQKLVNMALNKDTKQADFSKQEEEVVRLRAEWELLQVQISSAKDELNNFIMMAKANDMSKAFKGFTPQSFDFKTPLKKAVEGSYAVIQKLGGAFSKVIAVARQIGPVIATSFKAVTKVGGVMGTVFGTAIKGLAAVTSKAGELFSKMNPLTAVCKRLGKAFSTLGSKIKTAFIYSAVNSFFNSMKTKVTDWLSSNEQMKSSLAQLKGAWTTAFAPAVQAVIPILQKICAWATAAASAFAQLISLLTGQAVSTFKATAAGMENAANASDEMGASAGGAGDAAEEAQKQLAGFDELEVMDDKNKSSGGGGGADASTEAANSLADLLDGKKFNSWGEAFSSLLDGIISKIPAFDSALQTLANKINWFSSNLLEMFSFPGVLEKVSKLATDLANAFNHFLDAVDWKQLGASIGAGLNLAFQFVKDFIYTFNWTALGQDIAKSINGLIEQIDFTNVGATLVSKFNIIWQTIYGFVSTIDWTLVGNSLKDGINGIVQNIDLDSMAQAITQGVMGIAEALKIAIDGIDIETVKQKIQSMFDKLDIAGMINSILDLALSAIEVGVPIILSTLTTLLGKIPEELKNIKWQEIGTIIATAFNDIVASLPELIGSLTLSISYLIEGLLVSIEHLILEIDWEKLITSVVDAVIALLNNLDLNGILAGITGIVIAIVQQIPSILSGALQGIASLLFTIIEGLGFQLPEGLKSGILQGISDIFNWIKTNVVEPICNAFRSLFGIHSPSTVFNGFGQDLIAGLLKGISSTWGTIKNFFSTNFSNLKKLCSDTWENIKSKATTAWDNIKTKVSDRAETAKENINKSWENMKSKVNTTNENLKTYLQTSWDTLKSNLTTKTSTLKSTIESNWNTMKSNLTTYTSNLQTTLSNTWETMKSNIQTKTNTLKTDVETKWNTLKTNVSNTCNTLKTNLNTTYETIRSEVSNKISSMRTSVESTINTLKANVSTYTSSIKSTITTNMNTAKTNAVSAFTNMKTSISNVLEGLKTIVSNVFTWISNKVKAIWEKVNSARDAEDEDFDTGYVNSGPGATKMASGGVVTKPTLTWVGEYAGAATNPEIVTPQNLLTSIIDNSQNGLIDVWLQTTRQIIQTIENKDMDVRIDDSAIAGAVVRANTASIRRTGTPLLV